MNNIGIVNVKLSKIIGDNNYIINSGDTYINIISGELDIGFILADEDGTMAVCVNKNIREESLTYVFKTYVINAEINVDYLLNKKY